MRYSYKHDASKSGSRTSDQTAVQLRVDKYLCSEVLGPPISDEVFQFSQGRFTCGGLIHQRQESSEPARPATCDMLTVILIIAETQLPLGSLLATW